MKLTNDSDELCVHSKTELCALELLSGKIQKVSTVGVDDSIKPISPITEISFSKCDTEY